MLYEILTEFSSCLKKAGHTCLAGCMSICLFSSILDLNVAVTRHCQMVGGSNTPKNIFFPPNFSGSWDKNHHFSKKDLESYGETNFGLEENTYSFTFSKKKLKLSLLCSEEKFEYWAFFFPGKKILNDPHGFSDVFKVFSFFMLFVRKRSIRV